VKEEPQCYSESDLGLQPNEPKMQILPVSGRPRTVQQKFSSLKVLKDFVFTIQTCLIHEQSFFASRSDRALVSHQRILELVTLNTRHQAVLTSASTDAAVATAELCAASSAAVGSKCSITGPPSGLTDHSSRFTCWHIPILRRF
jgi:hypothetical protein